jgi:hypothetical protein
MPARKQQTHAKRARELAVKERRERKREKKALRAAGIDPAAELDENGMPIDDAEAEPTDAVAPEETE